MTGTAERTVTRDQVRRYRFRRHQLDRAEGTAHGPTDVDLLDLGVQDTGADGAAWALAVRGVKVSGAPADGEDDAGHRLPAPIALAWTLRGAPHAYRRRDLAAVSVATAPWSEEDASKRIFDASSPLNKAGVPILDALQAVATAERRIVRTPKVKGDLSGALTSLGPEYTRDCRVCEAVHVYEMPFRLAALQAGLELEPGTSPPVLHRVEGLKPNGFRHLADEADPRFDVIRGALRFFGPATMKEVITYLDAANRDVKAHWPEDAVEVSIEGDSATRYLLEEDLAALDDASARPKAADVVVRLVGSHDGYLQGRDRDSMVASAARRKALWPTIGRPGAVVADGEVLGLWRPKTAKGGFTLRLTPWTTLTKVRRTQIEDEAERLAAFRRLPLADIVDES